MTTELLLRPRELRLEDTPFLNRYGVIKNEMIRFEHSPKSPSYTLKTPVTVELAKILGLRQVDVIEYVLSLLSTRPSLLPFLLNNESLIALSRYFLRVRSGSTMSLYAYTNAIHQYSERLSTTPDGIITDVKVNGLATPQAIEKHRQFLTTFLGELQERKRSPGYIHGFMKRVRTFYAVNAVELPRIAIQKPKAIYKDSAPSQEQVLRLLDYATLREKVIICILCLSGMREGTLVRLKYGHIRDDFENGRSPIHIHVDESITKGQYSDYDTFIDHEATDYLRKYIEARKKGGVLHPYIGPEQFNDNSPLIRDELNDRVRGPLRTTPQPIGEKQLYKLIHSVIAKAALLKPVKLGHFHYTLRPHTLRKFYCTNKMSAGMAEPYVQYTMGHVIDTYNDVQSKGVEFLRNEYRKADLRVRPKTEETAFETLARLARQLGKDPERVLNRDCFAEPHRIMAVGDRNNERDYAQIILAKLKELANS